MKTIRVALLRGINVGSNKRVAMADLRALVEELGCTDVRTFLNSGNVVFSCSGGEPGETAHRMERALLERTGVSARVMVLTGEELADVLAANPLVKVADNYSRLLVGILADAAHTKKLVDIMRQDWGEERIALAPAAGARRVARIPGSQRARGSARAIYMWMPRGVIESKLNQAVAKALGDGVTARNWATVLKLKEVAEQTASERS